MYTMAKSKAMFATVDRRGTSRAAGTRDTQQEAHLRWGHADCLARGVGTTVVDLAPGERRATLERSSLEEEP